MLKFHSQSLFFMELLVAIPSGQLNCIYKIKLLPRFSYSRSHLSTFKHMKKAFLLFALVCVFLIGLLLITQAREKYLKTRNNLVARYLRTTYRHVNTVTHTFANIHTNKHRERPLLHV